MEMGGLVGEGAGVLVVVLVGGGVCVAVGLGETAVSAPIARGPQAARLRMMSNKSACFTNLSYQVRFPAGKFSMIANGRRRPALNSQEAKSFGGLRRHVACFPVAVKTNGKPCLVG